MNPTMWRCASTLSRSVTVALNSPGANCANLTQSPRCGDFIGHLCRFCFSDEGVHSYCLSLPNRSLAYKAPTIAVREPASARYILGLPALAVAETSFLGRP